MAAYYGNWQTETYTCRDQACGWSGPGAATERGEIYSALYEIHCPACGERIGAVSFPTIAESRANWDKVPEIDRRVVAAVEARAEQFAREAPTAPEQLPDLVGDHLVITWDIDRPDGYTTIIRHGDRVLWQEPAFYEGYERFIAVAALLQRKYGRRLSDLVPTEDSKLRLYGDRMNAREQIAQARRRLVA